MAQPALSERFEALRPELRRVAYRLLGSVADAEDVTQDAWLRLDRRSQATQSDAIEDLRAYLLTTVTRLCYDLLGTARMRRESYVGPWLPEPLVEDFDPADRLTLDESVSMALMLVLEELSPAERTAFVLHDTFGMSFADVATVVGRTEASVRQLASRARRKVRSATPQARPTATEHSQLVAAFGVACAEGDLDGLVALLDPSVVWRSDGGGRVSASLKPQRGAHHVARALIALARKKAVATSPALVNGALGAIILDGDGNLSVYSFTVDAGRIVAVDAIRNPDKLTHVAAPGRCEPDSAA